MLLLIEGVDRTGKSTLAASYKKKMSASLIHASAPTRHPLDEYLQPLASYWPGVDNIVLDRGYLGEMVWPKIFARHTQFDEPMRRYVELFMLSRGAVLVYARRDFDEIVAACKKDGEPIDRDKTARALAYFQDALATTVLPLFVYDQHEMPAVGDYALVVARQDEQRVARPHSTTHRWIGRPKPKILLVGERCGGGWTIPFVPYANTSGHFLMEELAYKDMWRNVAIVNAVRPEGGYERVPELHRAMGQPPIVALGRDASRVLDSWGLPHGVALHPQYVRRFQRAKGPGFLARQIEEAASCTTR